MKNILLKIKQTFCDHDWSETRGWYGQPKPGAVCEKCGKVNES